MSTKILKIDGEMPDEIELKVGNLIIKTAGIEPIWANPEILLFLRMRVFNFFFQFYAPEVPEWKIAHIEWSKKAQNIMKSPKN